MDQHIRYLKKYLPRGEIIEITRRLGASYEYVKKIMRGERPAESTLAHRVVWEMEEVVLARDPLPMPVKEYVSLWFWVRMRRGESDLCRNFLKEHLTDELWAVVEFIDDPNQFLPKGSEMVGKMFWKNDKESEK